MPKVKVICDDKGYPFHVLVDGVAVGLGGERECTALAEELRQDSGKADAVRLAFQKQSAGCPR